MKNVVKLVVAVGLAALAISAGCAGPTGTTGRGAEIVTCTPGLTVSVGCGALGLGTCAGDPILTVCDGATTAPLDCNRGTSVALASNDDYAPPNRCPGLTVVCPASGQLSVKPTAFSGIPDCNWSMSMSGI